LKGTKMKVKLLSRGEGKTTIAIRESARRQATIVCFGHRAICEVEQMARTLKLSIPQPISFEDFLEGYHRVTEVIIDNLDVCFSRRMPDTKVVMITINND